MGGWSCDACTVRNVEDNARKCQICETLRSEAADLVRSCKGPANVSLCGGAIIGRKRPSEPQKMSTVQATLFGGVAAKSVVQPSLKKPKTAEISKQSTLSFAAKQRPKTTSEDGGSGLVVWKECAGQDVPFSELKNRARIAMKTIFGVEKLRLLQPKAVGCALKRESQLVVMATGGGA